MRENQIITIGREYGSGGREIGMKLASQLGIPFYDKEILAEASKKSGYSEEIFERHDEKPTNSFLYALAMGVNNFGHSYSKPLMLEIYLAQFDTIRRMAKNGPGVFIGRCSDYVLNDFPNVFNVFVRSDMDARVKRISEFHSISEKEAEVMCIKNDKDRASYYNYYSNTTWGDSRHYDLCLNTAKYGIDNAVKVILTALDNLQ